MNKTVYTVDTPTDFKPVILTVLQEAEKNVVGAAVVTLTGDLGAGKTTFTQQFAKHLGVTEPVVSPTFGILKSYELTNHPHFDQLIHMDAYRIEHISEAGPLRLRELFSTPRTLVCLEWPEHIAPLVPQKSVQVTIEILKDENRKVTITLGKEQ